MEFRDSGLTFLSVPQLLQSAKPVVKADLESGVDVWGYLLDGDAQAIEQCGAWLTLEERTRASRFIRPEDQRRYIVGRGGLRKLLSGYTGLDPAAVIIQAGPEGKPALGNQALVGHAAARREVEVDAGGGGRAKHAEKEHGCDQRNQTDSAGLGGGKLVVSAESAEDEQRGGEQSHGKRKHQDIRE